MAARANTPNYLNPALIFSGLLHVCLLLFVAIGLPDIWKSHRDSLPVATTVEILPIAPTNVKPKAAPKPKPKTTPKKPKPLVKEKAAPEPKIEPLPMPKPVAKKKPKPPEPEKKKDPPKPKEAPKPDLKAILESVEKAANAQQSTPQDTPTPDEKTAKSDGYNPDLPLAMSEIDAIRQQFMRCWNIPAGARDAHALSILLNVRLSRAGAVLSVELAENTGRYYNDSFFRAAADSAMRAVRRCSPLRDLPPQKYESWKYLQINFDPHDVLY
jgi:outer membrane biosynthesis protein TonB